MHEAGLRGAGERGAAPGSAWYWAAVRRAFERWKAENDQPIDEAVGAAALLPPQVGTVDPAETARRRAADEARDARTAAAVKRASGSIDALAKAEALLAEADARAEALLRRLAGRPLRSSFA